MSKNVGQKVFIDPSFTGGRLHQGIAGSYLDMHTQFARHPARTKWVRDLNLLLYLNKGRRPEFGGCLDLENKYTNETPSIEPIENRMFIMLIKTHTIHGYKSISFPKAKMRTSIAAYAYHEHDGSSEIPYLSTYWYSRNKLRRILGLITNKLVALKQRVLGSRTAQRSQQSKDK